MNANGPDLAAATQVVEGVRNLTVADAERVAVALAIAGTDPVFESARFGITVGVRLDCAARVETEMLKAVDQITEALPGPSDEEPWGSAWEAAVDAACANIGGWYAYPHLSPPLLVAWDARTDGAKRGSRR